MSHNTLVHRVLRPVIRRIAPLGVTPNQLTVFRAATGLAAALAFLQGDPAWLSIGACMFLISAFLDRADGELARQTGQFSPSGHRFDLLADCGATAAGFLCLGVGLGHCAMGHAALMLGVLSAIGVASLFYELNVLKIGGLPQQDGAMFDPDDAVLLVPVAIWCGAAEPVLVLAGTLAPALALGLAVLFMRRSARQAREGRT